jgi:hypothetical protein
VAIKIKGSQGQHRVEWLNIEHPWTALSAIAEVHANHLEAFNSALRRRATAYRRRQNHYAQAGGGLTARFGCPASNAQLGVTPLEFGEADHASPSAAMPRGLLMGFIQRPLKLSEILVSRGLQSLTL